MAKSRKPQGYQDPLDSIFGFIFGNAKSKPVRTRPTRIRPGNASQDLARGLASIAATPANLAGDLALGSLGEAPNTVLVKQMQVDSPDGALYRNVGDSKVKITGANLTQALTDPNKFVDKVFQGMEGERKWARYLNAGRGLDTALLSVWAKKIGMNNKDAVTLGFAASNLHGPDQVLEARKKYAQNVAVGFLSNPSLSISKGHIRNAISELEKLGGSHIRSENDLKKALGNVPNIASRPDFNNLVHNLYEGYAKGVSGHDTGISGASKWRLNPKEDDVWSTEGRLNREGYISILRDNFGHRAQLLDATDPAQAAEQMRLLMSMNALDNVLKIKGPGFDGIGVGAFSARLKSVDEAITNARSGIHGPPTVDQDRFLRQLENLRTQMASDVQRASAYLEGKQKRRIFGFPVVGDYSTYKNLLIKEVDFDIQRFGLKKLEATVSGNRAQEAYFQNMIDSLNGKKSALASAPFRDYRITFADLVGAHRSIQENIWEGNLVKNFLTGKLYGDDYMKPGNADKFQITSSWIGAVMNRRTDISPIYASLNNLYYFTPGSLAKTFFFNGEGFAKLLFNQRQKNLTKFLTTANQTAILNAIAGDRTFLTALTKAGFVNDSGLDTGAIITNFPKFFEELSKKKGSLSGIWGELQGLYNKDQNGGWAIATKVFGAPANFASGVSGLVDKFKHTKWGAALDKSLKSFGKRVLGEKLGNMVAGLGIKQAISVLIQELAVSLGAAFGPLGSAVAFAVVYVGEALVMKIAKPLMKLFMFFIWATVLILFAIIGLIFIPVLKGAYPTPQGHLPPMDMMECTESNAFASIYKYTKPVNGGNFPPAPPNSTCPIIADTMRCTQGDGVGSSAYHQSRHSVDIGTRDLPTAVWYAPTDGTIVSYSATNFCSDGSNYGGVLVFKDSGGNLYTLTHVSALASGSVSKGQPVARALGLGELQEGGCWTGPHFHLDVQVGGSFVDAETWYKENLKCNIVSDDPSCN